MWPSPQFPAENALMETSFYVQWIMETRLLPEHVFFFLRLTAWMFHCVKSMRIGSYSGPYSVQMLDNRDQNNSKYGHFSRSVLSFN